MAALGQRTAPHLPALGKTLIGEGCWEYGGKIRTDGYGSVYIHNGTRAGTTARRMCRSCNNARRNRSRTAA